jgi:hypothetical protein
MSPQSAQFSQAILTLPQEELRSINDDFAGFLSELPDSFADATHALLRLGATPLQLFLARRGVELLFNRSLRAQLQDQPDELESRTFNFGTALPIYVETPFHLNPVRIPYRLIAAEIFSTPGLAPTAELPLQCWLFEALRYHPTMIPGYSARFEPDRLVFTRT